MNRTVRAKGLNRLPALVAALALAACQSTAPGPMAQPRPRPAAPAPDAVPESPESAATRAYYAQVQQALLSQGLLRTDGGGIDTPVTDRMLANNFLRIAMYEEYDRTLGGTVASTAPMKLTRWQGPVRVGLRFGASVSADKRATDTARIGSYLARLSGLTGLPIRLADANPNFIIQIASVDERRNLGPALQAALPELTATQVSGVTNLDRSTYCLVWTQSDAASNVYERAFVFIPSEHPDLMRLACIHEEIAQGLGLPNDSPAARPTIFNDDEEFAVLTRQDELMLRMLYSPQLRTGMTEAEARPIVETLATRLLGGES
jgi:hypothetical protein